MQPLFMTWSPITFLCCWMEGARFLEGLAPAAQKTPPGSQGPGYLLCRSPQTGMSGLHLGCRPFPPLPELPFQAAPPTPEAAPFPLLSPERRSGRQRTEKDLIVPFGQPGKAEDDPLR